MIILKTFKPKFWIIENPQSSLLWKFIKKHWNFKGIDNIAYYYNYDNKFSKKPTNFYSNINLDLIATKKTSEYDKDYMKNNSYKNRSAIPKKLCENIFQKIKEMENEL